MKKQLLTLALFFVSLGLLTAQDCPFEFLLGNIQAVDNGGTPAIEYDVSLRTTGPDQFLGNFDVSISFEPTAFTNPVYEQVQNPSGTPLFMLPVGFTDMEPLDNASAIAVEIFQNSWFGALNANNSPFQMLQGRAIFNFGPTFNAATSSSSLPLVTGIFRQLGRFRLTNYNGAVGDPSLAMIDWETPGLGVVVTTTGCYDPVANDGFEFFNPAPTLLLDVPLPIELVSFEGVHVKGEHNLLTWETAIEEDFSHFELEFGVNGIDFTAIDRQTGKATFGSGYAYAHSGYRAGNNYYRLKMVDLDGNYSYSDIVVINVNLVDKDTYNVFPIPTQDELFVEWTTGKATDAQLNVYDVAGKLVSNQAVQVLDGFNRFEIDMSTVAPGSYVLRVISDAGESVFTEKLTVIK
ncbi:MAG: T9SS type A sorting domain-containing protein [Bacteroidota bacterium]